VRPWLEDEDALRRASRAAKAFGRPDAAANVARLVSEHLPDANGAADSLEPAASTTIAESQGKRRRKRRRS
jgi:hypothetical protein